MYTEGQKIGYTLLSININVYILYYIFFLNATEKTIDTQAVCSLLLSCWNVLSGPLWYSSNIVESGIKHHNPNPPILIHEIDNFCCSKLCLCIWQHLMYCQLKQDCGTIPSHHQIGPSCFGASINRFFISEKCAGI
jgi:hypothetical protein